MIRYYVDPMVKTTPNEYEKIVFNSANEFASGFVYTLVHQKIGTVHYLKGFPIIEKSDNVNLFVGQFRATADFNEGDTFVMIDSTNNTTEITMVAEPMGMETTLPDEAFIDKDLVSVTIDGVNKKLGFKLGGSGVNDTLPPQIRNFTATAGNSLNKLSWELPILTEYYTGLTIVKKSGSIPAGVRDGEKLEFSNTDTSYTDTGLTNGVTYYYRAFPYNSKKQYQTDTVGAVTWGTPKAFNLPTYTGQHAIFGDETKGRIEMYSSGTLTLSEAVYDLFAVGGGASGGVGGGGGGYTTTIKGKFLQGNTTVEIGVGGVAFNNKAENGSNTKIGDVLAKGGLVGYYDYNEERQHSGSGGSGGGGNNIHSSQSPKAGDGGSDGADGENSVLGTTGTPTYGGKGQHKTTRAFEELNGTLYAGGGGGGFNGSGGSGGGGNGVAEGSTEATPNTGGGGGGFTSTYSQSYGGSGIAIIRWGY